MDLIGFLRAMQPSITAGLWILATTSLLYVVFRITLRWGKLEEDKNRMTILWAHRAVILITIFILGFLSINAVIMASTDRVPRTDADKAKSGVYRQMQNLEKKTR